MERDDQEELWENERYVYGFGWQKPGLLERPNWSDAEGHPVTQSIPAPSVEVPRGWQVSVTHATDAEGWQYASVFKHLEYDRPGGRASHRTTDFVRRRCWHRDKTTAAEQDHGDVQHAHAAYLGGREGDAVRAAVAAGKLQAGSLVSPATHMHGSRLRKRAEADRRMGAFRAFLSMLASTFRRRTFWGLVPMDPAAWIVMLNAHQAQLHADQAEQLGEASARLPIGRHHRDAQGQNHDRQDLFAQGMDPEGMQALIRRLTCAAMHARAAYGYAMAAGHMSSLLNFAMLQTVHQVSFNAAGGASGQANNEAVAALTGVPAQDLYMAEWHNSIMRPCHYLALHRSYGCLVLAIRGSLEIGDVLSDLKAEPMDMCLLGRQGKVHEGIMSAATYVHCNTANALQRAAKEHPGTPLLITGHSMGGSVGAVLAALLHGEQGTPEGLGAVHCVAIGAAPPMTHTLAAACDPFVTSVVLGGDVVPRLSYASVEGAFLELVNSSPVRNAATSFGRKVTEAFEGLKVDFKTALHPPHWKDPQAGGAKGLAAATQLGQDPAAAARAASRASASVASSSPCHSGPSSPISHADNIVDAAHFVAQGCNTSPQSPSSLPASPTANPPTTPAANPTTNLTTNPNTQNSITNSTPSNPTASLSDKTPRSNAADQSGGRKPGVVKMHRKRKMESSPVSHPLVAESISPSLSPLGKHDSSPPAKPQTLATGEEGETEEEKQTAGEGSTGPEDRAAAAEAVSGRESRGEHPDPLYLAGRVLWVLPDREAAAAAAEASGDDKAPADVEAWLSEALHGVAAAEKPAEADASDRAAFEVEGTAHAHEEEGESNSNSKPNENAESNGSAQMPSVLQVDRRVFERILLTAEMASDHLPDAYLEAIQQL